MVLLPMRRRNRLPMIAAVLAAAICAIATHAEANVLMEVPGDQQLVDRAGVAYISAEAYCAVHCKPWRRHRALNQCAREHCPQYHTHQRRQLEAPTHTQGLVHAESESGSTTTTSTATDKNEDEDVVTNPPVSSKLRVLSCGESSSASFVNLEIDINPDNDAEEQRNVFHRFHEAFFRAFDAMISSDNGSMEACQLQWLQQDLLASAKSKSSKSSSDSESKPTEDASSTHMPMLVRIHPHVDQRQCVARVKTVWTDVDEPVTPFLSRLDQSQPTSTSTILLLHLPKATAEQLTSFDCIASVTQLPPILKLLPFARSAFQLTTASTPTMWIRVLKGVDPQVVAARLNAQLAHVDGVTNLFELPEHPQLFPRGVFIKPVEALELWAHALALALEDDHVEWVDAKHQASQHTLESSLHRTLRQHVPQNVPQSVTTHRRLDTYVESLVGVEPAQKQGIRGDDVIVGITDSGLYLNHDQFDQSQRNIFDQKDLAARKVVYYNAWADAFDQSAEIECGHGTHVAGLLAGSSFSGQASNFGIAYNAKIAFMDIGTQSASCAGQEGCPVSLATPADASQLLQSQMDVGAKIFSFSWGTPGSDYSVQARDLDAFIYANPEILLVVAAGNSGEDSTNGQGTISSPSGAKNVISVGASLNAASSFDQFPCPDVFNPGSVASFSSAGPTTDGRMKPDIVAPGMSLVSSKSGAPGSTIKTQATCPLQGTSQATPVVTGIAVLLYQWLRDGWWKAGVKDETYAMASIPAALLKALIIHSGDSLERRLAKIPSGPVSCSSLANDAWAVTYPDMYQGYGKPNMSNIADFTTTAGTTPSLYFLPNSTSGSEPRVGHEKEVRISFTVPRGVDLRATLVWTDPPGSVRATTQLQHDLDLSVQIRNTSKVFYPLTSNNGTNRDNKNNVEMVVVSYQQLLDALTTTTTPTTTTGSGEATIMDTNSLLGPNGEIIVEAIVYGYSVLLADTQAFAFVASSSVIGSTSGIASQDDGSSPNSSSSPFDKNFWTPWTIGGVGAGALVLLALLVFCGRCCTSSRHRRPPGMAAGAPVVAGQYNPYTTPASGHRGGTGGPTGLETCPYCAYSSSDPVVMVNHVENMHDGINGGPGIGGGGGGFGLPPTVTAYPPGAAYPPPAYPPAYPGHQQQQPYPPAPPHYNHHQQQQPAPRSDEQCPFCAFASSDAVILVNHVEHLHGQQRVVV